jgi:DNA repair exonuclease SbcCD ATPase subunit
MSVNYKQLLETSYIQVSSRLEELQRFFAITRTFALKTNGHLKILTNLVNDLIDSEDMLHLVDTELTVHSSFTRNTYISQTGAENRSSNELFPPNHTVNVNVSERLQRQMSGQGPETNNKDRYQSSSMERTNITHNYYGAEGTEGKSDDKIIEKVIANFKQENEKLWQYLKRGDNDVDFIKTVFEKLLESYTNRDPKDVSRNFQNETIHQGHCNGVHGCHCMAHMMPTAPIPVMPVTGAHSAYIPPTKNFYKSGRKVRRSQQIGSGEFYDGDDEDEDELAHSVQSFKAELGKLNRKIEKLTNSKQEDSGIQDMLKKLIELKSENERVIKEKDEKISQLMYELKMATERVDQLKSEISYLKTNNKMLEETIHDIFKTQKNGPGFDKDQFKSNGTNDKYRQGIEKENDGLRDENINLRTKIEELKDQLYNGDRNKDQAEYYKTKNIKLQKQLDDADARNKELIEKNESLYELLEKKNKARPSHAESEMKAMSRWETDITGVYDDFLKCIYSQADYIEASMESVFANSLYHD